MKGFLHRDSQSSTRLAPLVQCAQSTHLWLGCLDPCTGVRVEFNSKRFGDCEGCGFALLVKTMEIISQFAQSYYAAST
jgi:hypothetical protein